MLTQEEQLELQSLEQELGQARLPSSKVTPSGLTQEEAQEMAQLEQELSQQSSSPVDAFIQNAGQAASFGYLPQIQAAAEPYIQKGLDFLIGDDTDKKLQQQGFKIEQAPQKSYLDLRDENIRKLDTLTKENPKASIAGTAAGVISSGIGLGGLFGLGAKTASTGARVAQAAKAGAGIGAVRNPGDVEGELNPLQLKDRALNVVKDAATGAVFQGGIDAVGKIGKVLKSAPESLKTFSQLKALKASGAMLKDFRKAFGNKKAYKLGQAMIDNGVIAVGDDIAAVAEKSEGLKQLAGQKLDEIYSSADDLAQKIESGYDQSAVQALKNTEIDLGKFVGGYKEKLAKDYFGKAGGNTVLSKIEGELDQLAQNGKVSLSQLREIRGTVDDLINYSKSNNEFGPLQKEFSNLRTQLNDLAKERIKQIDKVSKSDLLKKFAKENENYSNFAEISKMAKDKLARESSNSAFGLRERISGGVGASVGAAVGTSFGPVGAAVGSLAGGGLGAISTKLARKYGSPYVAITANKLAKALEKNQTVLDKFSVPLINAAKNSPKDFVNAVNIFLSEPEFRRRVRVLNRGLSSEEKEK